MSNVVVIVLPGGESTTISKLLVEQFIMPDSGKSMSDSVSTTVVLYQKRALYD